MPVVPVPVAAPHRKQFHGLAYVDEEYDDEGNELPRRMEVPVRKSKTGGRTALGALGLLDTTDIITVADHGFSTISKES